MAPTLTACLSELFSLHSAHAPLPTLTSKALQATFLISASGTALMFPYHYPHPSPPNTTTSLPIRDAHTDLMDAFVTLIPTPTDEFEHQAPSTNQDRHLRFYSNIGPLIRAYFFVVHSHNFDPDPEGLVRNIIGNPTGINLGCFEGASSVFTPKQSGELRDLAAMMADEIQDYEKQRWGEINTWIDEFTVTDEVGRMLAKLEVRINKAGEDARVEIARCELRVEGEDPVLAMRAARERLIVALRTYYEKVELLTVALKKWQRGRSDVSLPRQR